TRVDDDQSTKPHRFYRACGRSDIAGGTGGHKYEANAIEHRGRQRLDVDALNCTLSLSDGRISWARFLMHPMLNTAVKAARKAGSIINRASVDLDGIRVGTKGRSDFVTEVDHAAEHAIVDALLKAYPDHAILAEESGAKGESEYTWIIDPLDGTTNFIHGFPQYAVSIALRHRALITQAVVYDPVRNELFTATRGRGAFLNERRIRVSRRDRLGACLICTCVSFCDVDPI